MTHTWVFASVSFERKTLLIIFFHVLLQRGISHAFVSGFENEEDRKYYLENDPVHLDFVKSIGDVVARATVVDFVPGEL